MVILALWGIAGLALATYLFGLLGMKAALIAYRTGKLLRRLLMPLWTSPTAGLTLSSLSLFGILWLCCGTGAVFEQEFGLPYMLASAIMAGLSGITVISGLGRVIDAISIVVPLIAAVLGVGLCIIVSGHPDLTWSSPASAALPRWYISGLAYVSYNLTLSVPILVPMGTLATPQSLKKGAFLGALGLGISALAILLTILAAAPEITGFEIPMLVSAGKISPAIRLFYTFVLIAEIYTTAISSLYGFVSRVVPGDSRWFKPFTIIVAACSFLAGQLGFSQIVATVYPVVIAGLSLSPPRFGNSGARLKYSLANEELNGCFSKQAYKAKPILKIIISEISTEYRNIISSCLGRP